MSIALNPRVFVVCVAAYNQGITHGEWIALNQSGQTIRRAIKNVLTTSPMSFAENWVIYNHEDCGGINNIHEYANISLLARIGKLLAEHGAVVGLLLDYYSDIKTTREALENYYYGQYKSEKDFAVNYVNDLSEIPDFLRIYIDYQRFADDLFINDFFALKEHSGKVHIFCRH